MRSRMRRPGLTGWIGVVVALPTVGAIGIYVWLFVRSMWRQPTLEHLIALLFLWQTQTGAAFAIAAALIGATVILHQTETTRRIDGSRRERRASALRAVLPLVLSELIDYAAHCARITATMLAQPSSSKISVPNLQYPPLPAGLVDCLTELIEASEPTHANPLVTLLRRVQIHHARMRDTQRRASSSNGSILVHTNVVHRVIDSAEIYARCEKLLIYGRGVGDAPATPIVAGDVKKALFLIPTGISDVDELEKEIDRFASAGENGNRWPEE